MTAKAVGVDLNLHLVDLMAGDHLKPEFVKVIFHSHIASITRRQNYNNWNSRRL